MKYRTLTALLIGLALLQPGCAKESGEEPQWASEETAGKLTIHMMHLWPEGGAPGQHQIVNKIIAEYQTENPNVTIKQEVLDNERYKAKIRVLSAVNDLPDVGLTWPAGYLQDFVRGDLFTPLDDLLHGDLENAFLPGATEAYNVGGKTYALPLEFNIAPVYYNKRIFARYGLEPPATYEELLRIVKKLADRGVVPIALGDKDRWTGSLWYMYLADRIAGTENLASALNGTASFTGPGLIQAAKRIQDLAGMHAFSNGFNGLSNDEAKAQFMDSQAAMYLMGTWELPNYTTSTAVPQSFRDSMGFFKFPAVAGGKGNVDSWVGGPGVGLFVAENSPVKEEAKKFVRYFVKRWGEESVNGAGILPATKVDTSKNQLPQLYVDLLKEVNKATNMTLFADIQMPNDAAEVHLNQIQALFGREITPAGFAKAHDAAIKNENQALRE
ncbi:raffinose/stachyose/melibiose transport system substrate-binding protein [Paenibacillus sacheonensis]|nr:raffinose/stachyose/melibiose transport system substrate-binding protein [Paenibacillus sacheonensis]